MLEEKKSTNIEKVYSFLTNWGLFAISILIIISYTVFSANPDKAENQNIWTNILFVVLNLLAAFYISRQTALWGWQTDNAANQKKIAKTAIRHNRGNLTSIVKLIKITREKIELVEEPLTVQYLKEIRNHLEMIYNGIKNSEADFNEIVNEELKEQNSLEVDILDLLEEIEHKNEDLKTKESEQQSDKETIKNLKRTIKNKENELGLKMSSLPFGSTSYLSGSTFNLLDNQNNITIDKNSVGKIYSDYGNNQKKDGIFIKSKIDVKE
jgi:hypothetical protein